MRRAFQASVAFFRTLPLYADTSTVMDSLTPFRRVRDRRHSVHSLVAWATNSEYTGNEQILYLLCRVGRKRGTKAEC